MKCRGTENRIKIVKKYQLKPISHVKLLNGQEKTSCTGNPLKDSYYCFSYQDKANTEKGTFFCGSHAAKHFLELIDSEPLPFFNPLISNNNTVNTINQRGNSANKQWNDVAKQLSNAINLLVVCWATSPQGALASIKNKVDKYYYNQPYPNEIKGVNTILSYDRNNRTLQEMIEDLRVDNNVKEYDFSLLNRVLEEHGIESNYG